MSRKKLEEKYVKAETIFNNGNTLEALDILNEILNDEGRNINCLLLRANVFYKMQKWGEVLNDLNLILEIDPENQMAKSYKSMVINILSYWNKDNFNP